MTRKLFSHIDNLSFKYKTIILILIIAGGMISIVILSQISTFVIKENFDILFDKRTKSLIKLENIKDIYKIHIQESLKRIGDKKTYPIKIKQDILISQEQIKKEWKKYKKQSTLENSEFSLSYYINKTFDIKNNEYERFLKKDKLTQKIDKKIKDIKKYIQEENTNKINQEINSISILLTSLIKSDLSLTINEKKVTQKVFKYIIFFSIISIILVFLLSILLSMYLINNFRRLHHSLEQKVAESTKELKELNAYLEIKISKEVAQSRKKDLIMLQQARLASLGEMLNNIAHQWRQPLGAITMIIQSFQTKSLHGKLTDDFVNKKVKDALLLANNMSETLEDFKNFFSPNKAKSRFLIKSCLEHSIELSKYLLEKENIQIVLKIKDNVELNTYYNELSHVFLNLISNSKDALCNISNKNDKIIEILVKEEDQYAIIKVIDNGGGIPEDIIPKIFEPYYTTKYKSAGTGIGLYMSKQIIEKHMNGLIYYKKIDYKVNNKAYICSVFTIKIPIKKELLSDDD